MPNIQIQNTEIQKKGQVEEASAWSGPFFSQLINLGCLGSRFMANYRPQHLFPSDAQNMGLWYFSCLYLIKLEDVLGPLGPDFYII